MNKCVQYLGPLVSVALLSSCITLKSSQISFIQSLLSDKQNTKHWYLIYDTKRHKLLPLHLKDKIITFYATNNTQVDFTGWYINEVRLLSPKVTQWKVIETSSSNKYSIIVNKKELNATLNCNAFQKTKDGYKRSCTFKGQRNTDYIHLKNKDIVKITSFLHGINTSITLAYE